MNVPALPIPNAGVHPITFEGVKRVRMDAPGMYHPETFDVGSLMGIPMPPNAIGTGNYASTTQTNPYTEVHYRLVPWGNTPNDLQNRWNDDLAPNQLLLIKRGYPKASTRRENPKLCVGVGVPQANYMAHLQALADASYDAWALYNEYMLAGELENPGVPIATPGPVNQERTVVTWAAGRGMVLSLWGNEVRGTDELYLACVEVAITNETSYVVDQASMMPVTPGTTTKPRRSSEKPGKRLTVPRIVPIWCPMGTTPKPAQLAYKKDGVTKYGPFWYLGQCDKNNRYTGNERRDGLPIQTNASPNVNAGTQWRANRLSVFVHVMGNRF